jgi:hypothetical protein
MFFVKIIVQGWDSYTGLLGMVPFENGISTRPVTAQEAARLGASLSIVKVDSNEQVGASVNMASARNVSAEVQAPLKHPEEESVPIEVKYTKDRLYEIASEGGIKAVREIAKEFEVKGVEINKMIDDIMKVQLGTKE